MIRVVILEAKNLYALESAISTAKYENKDFIKVEGFTVHGLFRKRYYAILTGYSQDLEITVLSLKKSKMVKAYYSDAIEGQFFNKDKGEWEQKSELPKFTLKH